MIRHVTHCGPLVLSALVFAPALLPGQEPPGESAAKQAAKPAPASAAKPAEEPQAKPSGKEIVGQLLSVRAEHLARYRKLLAEGKPAEAIPIAVQVVGIDQVLLTAAEAGPHKDEEIIAVLRQSQTEGMLWLADQYETGGQFAKAIAAREFLLALMIKMFDAGDWRVSDARLNLAKARRLAALAPEQLEQLAKADRLAANSATFVRQKKHAQALPLAREAAEITRTIMGSDHRDHARRIQTLAEIHSAIGDEGRAAECWREVARIRGQALGKTHPESKLF